MLKSNHCSSRIRLPLYLIWVSLTLLILAPASNLYAQDLDEEEDLQEFFGDDEEFFEDEEEYLEDEEFGDEDEEFADEEEDEEEAEDDSELADEEADAELADQADRLGYTIDITASSPRYVNEELLKWNSSVNARVSIEFPLLMQFLGAKFRFGAEIGNFGFEDAMPPQKATLKGITAMGMLAFPAGPGKVKVGAGLVGKAFGVMAEATYGLRIGPMDVRAGARTTEVIGAKTNENMPIRAAWWDGLLSIGINL
ncbi:MAG: hypothetical protein QF622_00315 [Candidatus Marinimicrobia bacterium]|nr:hypothetical protein [Candidatus Neomarinimicrobiota bacterium]